MTDSLHALGSLLTASVDDRVLTYRLLPYGEAGRTNKGKVTASKGVLTIPDVSTLVANMEHDGTKPVARFISVDEDDSGLTASVRVLNTNAGNDLLVEAAEGVRTGISVEIDNPVIRAGALMAGALTGAGFVTKPAFPSAQLVAADAGELTTEGVAAVQEALAVAQETLANAIVADPNTPEGTEPPADAAQSADSENEVTAVTAAAPVAAPAGIHAASAASTTPLTASQAFRALATGFRTRGDNGLTAALADVTHDDGDNDGDGVGEIAAAPAWLGEVWSGTAYQRRYIPLVQSGPLTSYRETGFRFTSKPTVGKYAGNKAQIPTNGISVEPVAYGTERWAHGADLDRRFVDFGDTDVLRAFVEAQAESYKQVTDVDTLEQIIASADLFVPGAVPAGINETFGAIVDGALTLISDDFRPTFAIVGSDLYRDILLTPKDMVSEYLSSAFGLEEGQSLGFRIVPSAHADAVGRVTVGDGSTVRLKEFGGGTPIRVEAQHVANGGVDLAVFGYTSFQVLKDGGVVSADLVTV